ncbi:hypothetical protein C8J56DRAFT_924721 [Mycena floridula]|nr:hypothetical protein C8J56DRAFT_924721 [Mycena floridula]
MVWGVSLSFHWCYMYCLYWLFCSLHFEFALAHLVFTVHLPFARSPTAHWRSPQVPTSAIPKPPAHRPGYRRCGCLGC